MYAEDLFVEEEKGEHRTINKNSTVMVILLGQPECTADIYANITPGGSGRVLLDELPSELED